MNAPSEKEIQKAILEYLAVKKVFHWRNNSQGTIRRCQNDAYHLIPGTNVGSPDIMCILKPHGTLFGIEVKSEKGKLSEKQEAWIKNAKEHGAAVLVAKSLDQVMTFFQHYGYY